MAETTLPEHRYARSALRLCRIEGRKKEKEKYVLTLHAALGECCTTTRHYFQLYFVKYLIISIL
jgi:hypothetical protein